MPQLVLLPFWIRMIPKTLFALLLLTASAWGHAQVQLPDHGFRSPEKLLRYIYSAYRPWRGNEVARDKIFDTELLDLFQRDEFCSKAGGGVGSVDFDPFLDAQDFDDEKGISIPRLRVVGNHTPDVYEVSFRLFPRLPGDSQRKLLYTFVGSNGTYRIADIAYSKGYSLKQLLSQPCDL